MANDISGYLAQLLDLEVPSDISISKDARSLVYATARDPFKSQKKDEHPVSILWHAEVGKAGSARQLTSGFAQDKAPKLSPDGTTIAFISDRKKRGETSAIYLLSLAGGEPYPITPADNESSIEAALWSPDGKCIAFVSADEKSDERKAKDKDKDDPAVWGQDLAYNRLRIVDIETKKVETIVTTDEHVVLFDWHNDGRSLAFTTQPTPDIESTYLHGTNIYTVSSSGKDLRRLINYPSNIYAVVYSGELVHFMGVVSVSCPVSSAAVYSISLKDTECAHKQVTQAESDCVRHIRKIGDDLACYVQHGLEDHIAYVNGRTLVAISNSITSWDAAYTTDSDEVVVALVKSDINTPCEVYTTTASGGAFVQLSNHGTSYTGGEKIHAQSVSCKTLDDQETIEGIFLSPAKYMSSDGKTTKPLSTIVEVHGGPYYRITNSFNPSFFYFANLYLKSGYAVLFPNYRGSSGRGEAFAATALGGTGTYDQPDIVAMTQYCVEAGLVNKDEMIIAGWSQGGHLSYLSAVLNGMHKFGWKFKGAIPGAGVTDWDVMSFTSDIGFSEALFAGVAAWTTDKENVRNRTGSAIWGLAKAAEAKALPELLILHGQQDKRVPVEQARGFRRGLDYHKVPYEFVEYPREGHDINERKHLEDMAKRVLRFVEKVLAKN